MADITNFNLGRGESFAILLEIFNETKISPSSSISVPQNLSEVDFKGTIRENHSSDEIAAEFTIEKISPYTSGSILVSLTPQQTIQLDQRKYVYDLLMTSGSTTARLLLEGNFNVRPTTTR